MARARESGRWTPPTRMVASAGSPALVGRSVMVDTVRTRAMVQSVNPARHTVVVQCPDGTITLGKAAPQVLN